MKNHIIICLFVLVSCGQSKQNLLKKEGIEMEDKVHLFARDNKDMNAAIEAAARTLPEFERLLADKDSSMTGFSVKMQFGNEHMWLNELHHKEGKLYGVLDSDPMYVEDLNYGDTLPIKRESISDWCYIKKGKMIGGYTIRVMYNNLGEDEQKEFKEKFPYEFE